MILRISGNCADRFNGEVSGTDIAINGHYPPRIPGVCGDDCIDIKIDTDTGKLIGFKPGMTEDEIRELFEQ